MTVGQKLQHIRHNLSLTRGQLSKLSNAKEGTIKTWEIGKKAISINNLIRLINIFESFGVKVDLNWLLNHKEADYQELSNIFYDESLFILSHERAKKKLNTQDYKYTLEKVIFEIQDQYKIIVSNNIDQQG